MSLTWSVPSRWLTLSLTAWFSAMPLVKGAAPTLTSLFPAGGQKGSTFSLTTTGKTDATVRAWTDAPGVVVQSEGKANLWKVHIGSTCPAGYYQFRLYNAEGASELRWFRVGNLDEITEVEPNDEVGKGQKLQKLPICINARLEKAGDVDGYEFQLKKDEVLSVQVDAYSLGSAVDIMAHIVDSKGSRLHTASDDRNLDPNFTFKAPADGTYTVQLAGFAHPPQANVAYAGGINLVYRLQLKTGTAVTHVHPIAVVKGNKTEVALQGLQIKSESQKTTVEPAMIRSHRGDAWLDLPDALIPIQTLLAKQKPLVEIEPNQNAEQATALKSGDVVGGHIAEKGDIDRFVVEMKKGERLQATVAAKALGSALDPTLQIFAPDGKSVGLIDDVGTQFDPSLPWTASVDGAYQIVIRDTMRQGSSQHFYALSIAPPIPSCQVTLADAGTYPLAAGKSINVKVTVKLLHGIKSPLVLRATNLPHGVYAEEVTVPEKGGEVEIKLVAAVNAEPSQQPFQLAVWTKEEPLSFYPAMAPMRGESLRGTSLLDHTSDLWLTVTP